MEMKEEEEEEEEEVQGGVEVGRDTVCRLCCGIPWMCGR